MISKRDVRERRKERAKRRRKKSPSARDPLLLGAHTHTTKDREVRKDQRYKKHHPRHKSCDAALQYKGPFPSVHWKWKKLFFGPEKKNFGQSALLWFLGPPLGLATHTYEVRSHNTSQYQPCTRARGPWAAGKLICFGGSTFLTTKKKQIASFSFPLSNLDATHHRHGYEKQRNKDLIHTSR